jgi:hypothetical protein
MDKINNLTAYEANKRIEELTKHIAKLKADTITIDDVEAFNIFAYKANGSQEEAMLIPMYSCNGAELKFTISGVRGNFSEPFLSETRTKTEMLAYLNGLGKQGGFTARMHAGYKKTNKRFGLIDGK